MTYIRAVAEFKKQHKALFNNHVDYWTGEQAWASYTDALCKSGQITQKQFATWSTPFPYGKRLGGRL